MGQARRIECVWIGDGQDRFRGILYQRWLCKGCDRVQRRPPELEPPRMTCPGPPSPRRCEGRAADNCLRVAVATDREGRRLCELHARDCQEYAERSMLGAGYVEWD